MKKDVVYIDTEDDITSIIEKVKKAKERIIALVPPKRVGVLQSVVNLKLLHKTANGLDKRVVLITNDKALASLAAGVQIPVAKNLQSRPELATFDEPTGSSEDDIINGEELPVGELQKSAPAPPVDEDDIALPDDLTPGEAKRSPAKKLKKKISTVPNFNAFRKKTFLVAGGVVVFLVFMMWAIFFAPHATVKITAKTSAVDVKIPMTLNPNAPTNAKANTIRPNVQQLKKTNAIDFTATGRKDVGEKASGTITLRNCDDSDPIPIPANTTVSSDGLNFLTASAATIPEAKFTGGTCTKAGTTSVAVSAQDVGEQYNVSKDSSFTVAGQNSGVSATNPNAFTGGSKRTITIVSDGDIATASSQLTSTDQTSVKQQLLGRFDDKKFMVIDSSFTVAPGAAVSIPASGVEASKARLTIETTYTLYGLAKSDVETVLKHYVSQKIKAQKDQRMYDSGIKQLKFNAYQASGEGATAQFDTTGYIGPSINAKELKPQLVGKNYEEIRQAVKAIDGVDDVDTKFSPFWISRAPEVNKIDIQFVVSRT